jgi:hypothetical protein
MRENLINQINTFLGNHFGFFHSEEEVQILLAKYLLNTGQYDDVFVEYCVNRELVPNYPWKNDKKIAIDIVVRVDNNYIPIEIKYKTKRQIFPHYIFGSQTNVELSEQGAQNEGCYSFWKDVKRIELLHETFNLKYEGLVLFITNDPSYMNPPRPDVQYGPFSIHNERQVAQGTFLNWDCTKKAIKVDRAEKFPGFTISRDYTINWRDLNIKNHKYILT